MSKVRMNQPYLKKGGAHRPKNQRQALEKEMRDIVDEYQSQQASEFSDFCKQFWKDIEFGSSQDGERTIIWYKNEFLDMAETVGEAKQRAELHLERMLARKFSRETK